MRSRIFLSASALLLAGCASLAPDGGLGDVQQLTQGRTAGIEAALSPPGEPVQARVAELLQAPLSAESAVRIALLNNPALQGALATLGISDAQRVQAARAPNPHFSIGQFAEGERLEIERVLRFDVIGLLLLPWKSQWQGQQHELAKLQAAQEVIRLAADTRKAWVRAVAAQQSVQYLGDVKEAAEAGAELAQRMARAGNWSALQAAREQLFLADATAQLARARQSAVSEREQLSRLMGLEGTPFTLSPRLPALPAQAAEQQDVEARALRERLDVRAAVAATGYLAESLGLVKTTGYLDGLSLGYKHASATDGGAAQSVKHGWELELALPVFDWGGARNARAQGLYLQSAARVREVAVRARSEAREAYQGWHSAYTLARHYRDEVLPLRKRISEEVLLRYNGMLMSTWELLADTRAQVLSVNNALEAQRDFWLADTDLHTTLSGTSPGALAGLKSSSAALGGEAKGH